MSSTYTYRGLQSGLKAWWSYVRGSLEQTETTNASWSQHYQMLDAYYYQNGLYDIINEIAGSRSDDNENARPLRNPAYRVVEFYASKVWAGSLPDALPIETENDRIIDPIHELWKFSNWETLKQTAIRTLTKKGDLFLKVSSQDERVFLQLIQPEHVTDFDCDNRCNIEWIRLDIPRKRRDAMGKEKAYTHTEIWNGDGLRIWENDRGVNDNIESLGTPTIEMSMDEMGIDFVPFSYVPLKGDVTKRGIGAYTLQIDKIDEVNNMAASMQARLFRYNKPVWSTERTAVDGKGQAAVNLGAGAGMVRSETDDDIINLPGNTTLKSLVPDIDWNAARLALIDQMAELEMDMPELAYYNLRSSNQLSGTAIRLLLSDTTDRALEARAAAESCLVRAHKMALSIGQTMGIWSDIGSFDAGDFEHEFREREIIEQSGIDKATTFAAWMQGGAPAAFVLSQIGETDESIEMYKEAEREAREDENNGLAASLLNAQTQFDRGNIDDDN